jgi:hypothetical protein
MTIKFEITVDSKEINTFRKYLRAYDADAIIDEYHRSSWTEPQRVFQADTLEEAEAEFKEISDKLRYATVAKNGKLATISYEIYRLSRCEYDDEEFFEEEVIKEIATPINPKNIESDEAE